MGFTCWILGAQLQLCNGLDVVRMWKKVNRLDLYDLKLVCQVGQILGL